MAAMTAFKPSRVAGFQAAKAPRPVRASMVVRAASASAEVPSMEKRVLMNWLLLGAVGAPTVGLAGPYLAFFVPPKAGGGAGGEVAKDALGNDVKESEWVKTHLPNDRSLVQGLKGDATYLVVTNDNKLESYGINAVCTHLGCVVPWNSAENKFMCPCHGSQYDAQGKKIRGPAPLSLALAHVNINDDIVLLSPWTETDFRTGEQPWWR